MVQERTFREDLYYRLEVIHLHVPPLRERTEDIALLALHFLEEANERHGTRVRMQREAITALTALPLPGNARQLKHIVERLVVAAGPDGIVLRDHVEQEAGPAPRAQLPDWADLGEQPRALHEALAVVERRLIERALVTAGSVAGAAKALGISRSGLYDRMERLGIDREA
jgi:DNA-binding NtrC family response regulator